MKKVLRTGFSESGKPVVAILLDCLSKYCGVDVNPDELKKIVRDSRNDGKNNVVKPFLDPKRSELHVSRGDNAVMCKCTVIYNDRIPSTLRHQLQEGK